MWTDECQSHSHIFWSCIKNTYIFGTDAQWYSKDGHLSLQNPDTCMWKGTRSRLKCDPPGPGQWLDIIEEINSMEKLTHYLRTKAETHNNHTRKKVWKYWTKGSLYLFCIYIFPHSFCFDVDFFQCNSNWKTNKNWKKLMN